MKFLHIADCHLGAWSTHPEIREMPLKAFETAMNVAIEKNVDFIIIAGDLFDTSIPPLDILKQAVKILKRTKEHKPIYVVPGSHDYSPTGKTMIDVLDKAGLLTNVYKPKEINGILRIIPTFHENIGIYGMLGRKGALEHEYYRHLKIEPEGEKNIFVFHSAITELKPTGFEKVIAMPINLLPSEFDYYCGGHIHEFILSTFKNAKIIYPGTIFATDFKELEKNQNFCALIDIEKNKIKKIPINICETKNIFINANEKTPQEVEKEILENLNDIKNKIILLRIEGLLKSGKPSEINFGEILEHAKQKGALTLKKNISKLSTKRYQKIEIKTNTIEEIENHLIEKCNNPLLARKLFDLLNEEKRENETRISFEERIRKKVDEL